VEFILVRLSSVSINSRPYFHLAYLQVAQLSELLPTIIKFTGERLDLLVDDFVSAHISTLRKGLSANIATVRSLARVPSLMCLQWLESVV
jgi:hypothetical protein